MNNYYFVQYEYEDDEYEIVHEIGVFSSKSKAIDAIILIKARADYKKQKKERFYVNKAFVDRIDWAEGYFIDNENNNEEIL
jgi:hypothetical protein